MLLFCKPGSRFCDYLSYARWRSRQQVSRARLWFLIVSLGIDAWTTLGDDKDLVEARNED
jgi:hypothetical protein